MNLQEFEAGMSARGVCLDAIPVQLYAKWFREFETDYVYGATSDKNWYYDIWAPEVKKRIQALREWRFTSNLELAACLRLAEDEHPANEGREYWNDDDEKDAKKRSDVVHEAIEILIGNGWDDAYWVTEPRYVLIVATIQALRGVLSCYTDFPYGEEIARISKSEIVKIRNKFMRFLTVHPTDDVEYTYRRKYGDGFPDGMRAHIANLVCWYIYEHSNVLPYLYPSGLQES